MPGHAVSPAATVAEVLAWTRRDDDGATFEEAFGHWELAELVPDLDSDPGDGEDAWDAQAAEWARAAAEANELPPGLRGCFPAGLCPRDDGDGGGFAAGGMADRLPPGVVLAGLTGDAWQAGLGRLSDDELIGVLRAWHRLESWAAAGELAAVAELAARRVAEVEAGADSHLAEHVGDELAVSLTLTGRAADALLDFACELARLPLTAAALASGTLDRGRARVIADELGCLDPAHAAVVEAQLIGRAGRQTTGQLRAAARRAVLAADPAAANRRCEKARKQARVEVWDEGTGGTAALAGRDLPPSDVLAADKRIDTLARHLRAAGADGTMDQLRAQVYVALLLGHPIDPATTPAARNPSTGNLGEHDPGTDDSPLTGGADGSSTPAGPPGSAAGAPGNGAGAPGNAVGSRGIGVPPVGRAGTLPGGPRSSVNLTMPLSAWLGISAAPGEAAGFGPIPATDARALANLAAAQPGTRWCLTFTDHTGRAIAHGCAHRKPRGRETPGPPGDWELTVTIRPIATSDCAHLRETARYRPSPSLAHIVNIRQRTCSFPGCRRQATKCDLDHTIPYDQGGRTCQCNLATLCRRHHRAKQAQGWHLEQPQPGVLVWRAPHGRTYLTEPDLYPEE